MAVSSENMAMKDLAANYVEDESGEENIAAEQNSEEDSDESGEENFEEDAYESEEEDIENESGEENVEDKSEEEDIEEDDEESGEENQNSFESISDHSSNEEVCDYEKDELPNLKFKKFVIPRVPGSAFSTDILKYMKKNAQPRTALKLMQICKYFCHEEFPFLPMQYIKYYEDYGFSYCTLHGQEVQYAYFHILNLFKKKLWITDEINIDYAISIDFFLHYIVACDLQELYIDGQKLLFDQFKFLTFGGKIKILSLCSVSLKYENGDSVPLEEILKCVPNVEEFAFERSSIHHENVSAFIKFLNPEKLSFFALGSLTENFDFDYFINFITKYPKIQYSLRFNKGISDKFFIKLQTFVEDIRKAGSYSKFVFSRIYCHKQTWRYGFAEWNQLPDVFCLCGYRKTLYSNYDPPYFRCKCKKYLMLASTEAWNEQFHGYYE